MTPVRLGDRCAIVTGAGSGIGKAIALRFAAEGASVVCADIDALAADATRDEVARMGGQATCIATDVSDSRSVERCASHALDWRGAIDILVNSAGIIRQGDAMSATITDWDAVISVNLTGSWLMCRSVLPAMVGQSRGSIVNIASISSIVADPLTAAYTASKGGVAALTRSIALDFAQHKIRANAICPGTTKTPLVINHYLQHGQIEGGDIEKGLAAKFARYPLRRFAEPEEVAALAAYLASDEAGFMTGALLPLDGGLTATAWQLGQ